MTTVALVGVGYWGRNLLRVFSKHAAVKTCVHNGSVETREWILENYPGVNVTTDYESVLSDQTIDAVVIATPIDTHYELVRQALIAGKDVYVEKPLAETSDDAEKLVDIASDTNAILFVGYIFAHHPTLQPLIELAKSQQVEWAQFAWHKFGSFDEPIDLDIASHAISIALLLFDASPDAVQSTRTKPLTTRTDQFSATLQFPQNRTFDISLNRLVPDAKKFLQIRFEGGEFYYWSEADLYKFSEKIQEYELVESSDEEPLMQECHAFLEAVCSREAPITDVEFGLDVSKIMEQM